MILHEKKIWVMKFLPLNLSVSSHVNVLHVREHLKYKAFYDEKEQMLEWFH